NKYVCDVCGSGMDGRCRGCGHYCGFRGGHILRWVLGILIITWIFSIGMKVGELKSYLEGGEYGGYAHMRYNVMPMMGGNAGYYDSTTGSGTVIYTSAAPATLPKK